MPAAIEHMANEQLRISSVRWGNVEEASNRLRDSRSTHERTSEHYRGNNMGEVVFASKDHPEQVGPERTISNDEAVVFHSMLLAEFLGSIKSIFNQT